jgi:hypothetical protein
MEANGTAHRRTLKQQSPLTRQTATGGDLKNGPVQIWYEGQIFHRKYCNNPWKNLIPPRAEDLESGSIQKRLSL